MQVMSAYDRCALILDDADVVDVARELWCVVVDVVDHDDQWLDALQHWLTGVATHEQQSQSWRLFTVERRRRHQTQLVLIDRV